MMYKVCEYRNGKCYGRFTGSLQECEKALKNIKSIETIYKLPKARYTIETEEE